MITGEAGAGKTSVLLQLVRQQAELFAQGRATRLYLYINAQGRALARFNEAVATELQDLRSRLTYHELATLVRLDLLCPIIDGFDELVGVGTYDDAFSSFSAFIEELEGEGSVVASARSAYYEQEFLKRANTVTALGSQIWTLKSIEILSWRDEQISDYVEKFCEFQHDSPCRENNGWRRYI